MLTCRGQLDPGMTSLEQNPAESVFQRLDARADSRLRDMQVLRGAVKVTAIGDFEKGTDMVDFHASLQLI
jgi:hypothetical protein